MRFPDIGTSAGEAKSFEAHGFEGDVAGEDHEIGPGNLVTVFFLDGPEKAAGFVEVSVIRPAVERSEAESAVACTTATIGNAVSAGAVPSHADEERTVVTVIGGPPFL